MMFGAVTLPWSQTCLLSGFGLAFPWGQLKSVLLGMCLYLFYSNTILVVGMSFTVHLICMVNQPIWYTPYCCFPPKVLPNTISPNLFCHLLVIVHDMISCWAWPILFCQVDMGCWIVCVCCVQGSNVHSPTSSKFVPSDRCSVGLLSMLCCTRLLL